LKASITIEAAFLLSIILLILSGLMKESISLFEQVEATAAESEVENLEPVEYFERWQKYGDSL
jgi:hypothetical protein